MEAVTPVDVLPQKTYGAMLKGGVEFRDFSDRVYNGASRIETWHIPCTEKQRKAFWEFLLSQRGKPYDWKAICAFGIGERDWTKNDSWFCSELQLAAMKESQIWTTSGEAHIDRIDPGVAYLLITSLEGAHK